ncbi:tetratricopeptide-like helical domain-containing protein [Tanacetum coccineum]
MASRRLVPDIFTHNSLVNGYCKTLMIDEAMHLFPEITKRGLKPDVVTYSTMTQGLFWVGRCGDVRKLFDVMVAKDINVYNILINGVGKCGKFDYGLCREGLVRDAKQLFLQIAESGCPSDNVIYCLLLQGYLRNQYYDDMEILLHEMDGRGFSLDASTLSLLLDQTLAGSLDTTLLELIGKGGSVELICRRKKGSILKSLCRKDWQTLLVKVTRVKVKKVLVEVGIYAL